MYGRTDKRTDGRSDYIMPQILFGGHKKYLTPNYGWRKQSKCIFDSDRRFDFRKNRDIQVRDIESRLYVVFKCVVCMTLQIRSVLICSCLCLKVAREVEHMPFQFQKYKLFVCSLLLQMVKLLSYR